MIEALESEEHVGAAGTSNFQAEVNVDRDAGVNPDANVVVPDSDESLGF